MKTLNAGTTDLARVTRAARTTLMALFTLVALGCGESLVEPELNGPVLLRANAGGGTTITATFDQDLDDATVHGSRFRVTASLANGRGANFGNPVRASYRGNGTVELTMRNPVSGAGLYTVTALDIRGANGALTEQSFVSFDFVP